MAKRIYLSPPHMSGDEMEYVRQAFEKNWVAPIGENVDEFEKAIEEYLDIEHAVALSSGTAALHLALINLGIKAGDEVLVPTLTFCASVNAIVYQSAVPVFVDSEKDTWNMSPELLSSAVEDRIRRGKKPKAIILVHLYGMPARIDEIKSIASRYEIPVVEDAAEALGSKYKGQHVGTFGKIGILSFNGNKIITTSGGGALITNDQKIAEKALFFSTQARDEAPYYQHSEIGFNYRMSNILAGIGRGQMEHIDEFIIQRRENYNFYKREFEKYDFVDFLTEPEGIYSTCWLTTMLFDEKVISPGKVRLALEKEEIEGRFIWKPMHMQPVFKNYPGYLNGTAEAIFKRGLCLPSGSNLTSEDRQRVANALHNVFQENV